MFCAFGRYVTNSFKDLFDQYLFELINDLFSGENKELIYPKSTKVFGREMILCRSIKTTFFSCHFAAFQQKAQKTPPQSYFFTKLSLCLFPLSLFLSFLPDQHGNRFDTSSKSLEECKG